MNWKYWTWPTAWTARSHRRPRIENNLMDALEPRVLLSTGIVDVPADSAVVASASARSTVHVNNRADLISAVNNARPGTTVLVAPGVYDGGMYFSNVHGQAGNRVVIRAADPNNRPIIRGGGDGIKFSRVSQLEVHDLIIENASSNGLNVDDGGSFGASHHIRIENVHIRNIGSGGNQDGVKISGVKVITFHHLTVENWGSGGSGIDLVGVHHAKINRSTFRHRTIASGNGVQVKGGSRTVQVTNNRFENAGSRAIQVGGRTETQYFRPSLQSWEAKDVLVRGNEIIGSHSAIAFANIDGGVNVQYNTIYRPRGYVFRILKENTIGGMVNTRGATISHNLIVWRQGEIVDQVNIGPNTDAGSFQFRNNWWFNGAAPANSTPRLPSSESGGVHGVWHQMIDPARGNIQLRPGSPAVNHGAQAAW